MKKKKTQQNGNMVYVVVCSTTRAFYSLCEPFFQLFFGATRGINNITVGDDTKAAVSGGHTLMDWKDTEGTTSR